MSKEVTIHIKISEVAHDYLRIKAIMKKLTVHQVIREILEKEAEKKKDSVLN